MERKRVGKCASKRVRWNDGRGRKGETESMAAVQEQRSSTIVQTLSTHDLSSIQNEVRGQLNLSLCHSLVNVTVCMTNPACGSDYLALSQKESESMDGSCCVKLLCKCQAPIEIG